MAAGLILRDGPSIRAARYSVPPQDEGLRFGTRPLPLTSGIFFPLPQGIPRQRTFAEMGAAIGGRLANLR